MKIIYSCYGGAHTSIVAAGLHLGYLPHDKTPNKEAILSIPFFDQTETANIGVPLYMGQDQYNNEVYVIGMGSYRKEGAQLIYRLVNDLRGGCRGEVIIINSIALINLEIRIGGFLSRRLGLVDIGRRIIIFGIRRKYDKFLQLRREINKRLGNNEF